MLRGIKWQYLGLVGVLIGLGHGCNRLRPASLHDYEAAQSLYRHRQMRACLAASRSGLRGIARERHPDLYFRYRLLEAASLVGLKDHQAALSILAEPIPANMRGSPEAILWRMNLGMAHLYASDFSAAATDLRGALEAAKSSRSDSLVAEVQARLGALALRSGDNATAEKLLRSALDEATREGNSSLRVIALGNLGVLLTQSFRLEEAVYWQEQAATEFRQLGDLDSVARVTGNLGWTLLDLGDEDAALARFREAEAASVKAGNRVEQLIWVGQIGNVQFQREDFAAAEASYRRAADLARALDSKVELTWWLDKLATVALLHKDYAKAEDLLHESTQLAGTMTREKPDLQRMNIAAEIAAARGRPGEAESLYREVAGAASEDPGPALNARAGLAALYASRGQNKLARAQYAATIALAEAQRDRPLDDRFKLPWSSSLTRFYRGYVEFLIGQGDLSGALAVADSTRSRMLLNSSYPSPATAAGYRDIARRAQSVILAYWLAPERSYLWEITSDGIRLHTLPGSSSIRTLVAAHNGAIAGSRNPIGIEGSAGQRLWEVLISPAAATIARIPRVIFVPDGPICSLNLESLPVPGDHPHYFIDDARVTVTPALWMLRPAKSLRPTHASLLLTGDPEPSGPEFPRLTYATQEIDQIEQHFNGMQRVVLQGAAATREAWLRADPGKYSMLHFAGHAASNPISPLQSALVLSPGAGGHLLTAADVMNLHLNANLVTISACRGAGSRIYSGEGLVGLTWSFLRAGARGVIAGLWDVPDRPTAMLMGSLYQRLAAGERPQEALRDAKLAILRSGPASSKPYNWAAFQYYSSTY